MFKPCPNCGFLVALIAGREASQRCPRCGSALVTDADLPEDDAPRRRRADDAATREPAVPVRALDRDPVGTDPRDAAVVRSREERAGRDSTQRTMAIDGASLDAAMHDVGASSVPVAGPEAMAHHDDARVADTVAPSPVDAATEATATGAPPAPAAHDGPSFARRREAVRRRRGRRWPWAIALAALALLLGAQLLLAQRRELARDPGWRPLVLQACGLLGCDVPPWHAPREFAMLARGVRPDPARPGVLRVTATLRNDARWPQPAPVVVLSLSDVDGRLVGARAVAPREYGHRPGALVAPGNSIDVTFDVREPPGHVESFDFQLQ